MKPLILIAALAFGLLQIGCGTTSGPAACETTCDCAAVAGPTDRTCAGEWICNAEKTCQYACQPACSGQVYTCPADSDCDGAICSVRKVLGC